MITTNELDKKTENLHTHKRIQNKIIRYEENTKNNSQFYACDEFKCVIKQKKIRRRFWLNKRFGIIYKYSLYLLRFYFESVVNCFSKTDFSSFWLCHGK